MDENPYRSPLDFDVPQGSWLDAIGPGWYFPLTIGGGLGLGGLGWCLDKLRIDLATVDRIGFWTTVAWMVLMIGGGIVIANLKKRRHCRERCLETKTGWQKYEGQKNGAMPPLLLSFCPPIFLPPIFLPDRKGMS